MCKCVWSLVGAGVLAAAASAWAQTAVFSDSFDSDPENFEGLPGGQYPDPDAAATWSTAPGGQSGKCMQLARTDSGTSARALQYTVYANTTYTLSIYISCPAGTSGYWTETSYKQGSGNGQDFIEHPDLWTLIQRFANDATNGNGDTWTQYIATFTTGPGITTVSVGFKVHSDRADCPVIKWDTLVFPHPGGLLRGSNWPFSTSGFPQSIPGMVYNYKVQKLEGSDPGHQKNNTAAPAYGGSVFEVNANPIPYASYHQFDPQTGILTLDAWIWDDVESRKPQGWPNPAQIDGGVMLTTNPDDIPIIMNNGTAEIYTYADFDYVGIQSFIPYNKPDCSTDPNFPWWNPPSPGKAADYCYQWRTAVDGWNLTLNPNTGKPVPRRADFRIPEQIPQTWRHVRIVAHPYSGSDHDLEFYMDDPQNPETSGGPLVLVGHGHRAVTASCGGFDLRRIQMGARFPEVSDATAWRPPYSYEHLWFDDVLLTNTPPTALPCPNPLLRYDADNDGDVDMDDFAVFQLCYTGGAGALACPACKCMNADGNSVIDGSDFAAFKACADTSGAGIPANPACEAGLPPP